MTSLVTGGMIVPGDPDGSPFFDLVTEDGPMFMIFEDEEIEAWRAWARSLSSSPDGGPAAAAATPVAATPAERMVRLIDTMRPRQDGVSAHAEIELTGPDPADPDKVVTQPVAWWFGQPPAAFMRALATEDGTRMLTGMLNGRNAMARALAGKAPGLDGVTWVAVATAWIEGGCPIPADDARPLTLLTPPERVAAHPTGQIHGSGSVH
jgi:hypothetical protein